MYCSGLCKGVLGGLGLSTNGAKYGVMGNNFSFMTSIDPITFICCLLCCIRLNLGESVGTHHQK